MILAKIGETEPYLSHSLVHCVENFIESKWKNWFGATVRFRAILELAQLTRSVDVFLSCFCMLLHSDWEKARAFFPEVRIFVDRLPCKNQMLEKLDPFEECRTFILPCLRRFDFLTKTTNRRDIGYSPENAYQNCTELATAIYQNLIATNRNDDADKFADMLQEFLTLKTESGQ